MERLIPLFQTVTLSFGNSLYRKGDSSKGVYIVLAGELELTAPTQVTKTIHEASQNYEVGVKHIVRKNINTLQDKSAKNSPIALLTRGAVIGLEECNTKSAPPPARHHTLKSRTNDTKLLFLPYETFVARVLNNQHVEPSVRKESMVHAEFNSARRAQQERVYLSPQKNLQPQLEHVRTQVQNEFDKQL